MRPAALAVASLASLLCARSAAADEAPPDKSKDTDAKPPQVRLVVDGDPGVLLERRQTVAEGWNITFPPAYQRTETWEVSCVVPCKTVVDAGSIYRVNGSGVATSYDFTLPQGRDQLSALRLVSRSEVLHGTGIVLTVVGSVVALFGTAGLVSAPVVSDAEASTDLRVGGWGGVGVGAAMVVVRIPLWIMSHSFARDRATARPSARPARSWRSEASSPGPFSRREKGRRRGRSVVTPDSPLPAGERRSRAPQGGEASPVLASHPRGGSRQSAMPPRSPASFDVMVTWAGSSMRRCFALPPPR